MITMNQDRIRRNLWTITLAGGISRFGDNLHMLATNSLTYSLSHSMMAMAALSAVTTVPSVLLAGLSGRWADRSEPRRMFATVYLLLSGVTLAFIPVREAWVAIALNFLCACIGAFAGAVRAPLLRSLVGRANLLKANSRQSAIMGVVGLVGLAAAGSLVARVGPGWAFLIVSLTSLAPVVAMLLVRPVSEPGAHAETQRAPGRAAGPNPTRAFLHSRPDLAALVLSNGAFYLGLLGFNTLFYPYVAEVLHAGPEALGWSLSLFFGSGLVGGAVMERWGSLLRRPAVLKAAFCLAPLIWLGFTMVRSVGAMLVLSALNGILFSLVSVLFATRIQEEAPREALGRINATAFGIQQASAMAGMLLSGAAATFWGVLPGMRSGIALASALALATGAFGLNRSAPSVPGVPVREAGKG